jgi:hypothetical protein
MAGQLRDFARRALAAVVVCGAVVFSGVAGAQPAQAIEPHSAPMFTSPAQTSVAAKTPLQFEITTSGVPAALVRALHLPPWLVLSDNNDGSADLTGTPPRAATTTVQLVAGNHHGGQAQQTLTITAFTTPKFISDHRTLDAPGETVFVAVNARGFPTPTLSSADLPSWATLTDNRDGTGTLTATPPTTGTFVFTLTATNIGGSTDQLFTLRVKKGVIGRAANS